MVLNPLIMFGLVKAFLSAKEAQWAKSSFVHLLSLFLVFYKSLYVLNETIHGLK